MQDTYTARAELRNRIEHAMRAVEQIPQRVATSLPTDLSEAERSAVLDRLQAEVADMQRLMRESLSRVPADA